MLKLAIIEFILTPSPALEWGYVIHLPGIIQTTPRAELFAIVHIAVHVEAGNLEIVTDSFTNFCLSKDPAQMH